MDVGRVDEWCTNCCTHTFFRSKEPICVGDDQNRGRSCHFLKTRKSFICSLQISRSIGCQHLEVTMICNQKKKKINSTSPTEISGYAHLLRYSFHSMEYVLELIGVCARAIEYDFLHRIAFSQTFNSESIKVDDRSYKKFTFFELSMWLECD